tara:strand:+ start:1679 stop:1948 length:270 start_codon:yes stop_codon:yes gene_type:complete
MPEQTTELRICGSKTCSFYHKYPRNKGVGECDYDHGGIGPNQIASKGELCFFNLLPKGYGPNGINSRQTLRNLTADDLIQNILESMRDN